MSKHNLPPPSEDEFLTTREAAQILGVALRTAQLWVEAGTLKAWKTAGGHRRISRDSVDFLLAQQAKARSGGGSPVALELPNAAPFHVLVVDDDAVMREVMVVMIRSWNLPLTVSVAEDGFAALVYIGERRPDLLLTDLIMPGMDGFRMIRHLRALPEAHLIEIIAITGQDLAEIAAGGLLPPDVPVLPKPVSFAKLKDLVEEAMHRHGNQVEGRRQ